MKRPNLHSFLHRRRGNHELDRVILLQSLHFGAVAQLGEHRLCKPGVVGSSPIRSIPSGPVPNLRCGPFLCRDPRPRKRKRKLRLGVD